MKTRKGQKKSLIKNSLFFILLIATFTTVLFIKEMIPVSADIVGEIAKKETEISLPNIKSKEALLIKLKDNQVISSKNPDKKAYPASLTKMMSAYLVIQQLTDLTESIEVPASIYDSLVQEGASLAGFYSNEKVPAKDLLYGLMLPSGAEATLALAIHVAGSEAAFVELMNQKAQELGMDKTHFVNATGLHHRKQYSTARDMATLLTAALQEPAFREVFTAKEHQYVSDFHPEGLLLESRVFRNLESSHFNNGELLGGKTGYTEQAGQCLASLAQVNGEEYILITMGADGSHETNPYHIEDALTIYQSL